MKKETFLLLTSEEGMKHRSQRPIEPEAAFGQMKEDMHYKRFRHFGKDKVYMDIGLFGIGFNLKKHLGINDKTQFGLFYRMGQLCPFVSFGAVLLSIKQEK